MTPPPAGFGRFQGSRPEKAGQVEFIVILSFVNPCIQNSPFWCVVSIAARGETFGIDFPVASPTMRGSVPGACVAPAPSPRGGLLSAAGPGAGGRGPALQTEAACWVSTLRFVLRTFPWSFPKEASKPVTTTQHSLSIQESPAEPVVLEEPVPSPGGPEWKQPSTRPNIEESRCGARERGSASGRSSASDSGRSQGTASGTPGQSSACSHDSDFESSRAVRHFHIDLPQELLECGARGHSLLQTPGPAPADRGVMRRMALGMAQ